MKKFYSLITLLILALLLSACGTGQLKDPEQAKEYLNATVSEYKNAQSVSVALTMESGEKKLTTELAYNTGASVEYLIKMTDEVGTVTSIVKDNKSYMDRYGTKTVMNTSAEELDKLMNEYSFEGFTKLVLSIFSNGFFDASQVLSSEDGKALLECDVFSLLADSSLSEEEQLEQEELIASLQMLSSLKLEMEFSEGKVTKLTGLFEDMDGNVSKAILEFKSTQTQTIAVENASEYEAR